jgi:hypothetical protein
VAPRDARLLALQMGRGAFATFRAHVCPGYKMHAPVTAQAIDPRRLEALRRAALARCMKSNKTYGFQMHSLLDAGMCHQP